MAIYLCNGTGKGGIQMYQGLLDTASMFTMILETSGIIFPFPIRAEGQEMSGILS